MSKSRHKQFSYGPGERRAEREIDNHLRKVNGAKRLDIMQELRELGRS